MIPLEHFHSFPYYRDVTRVICTYHSHQIWHKTRECFLCGGTIRPEEVRRIHCMSLTYFYQDLGRGDRQDKNYHLCLNRETCDFRRAVKT